MAISLNGNGVLTGVTTIPDGIVTNDDLAGSIAISKLATTGSASSSTFLDGSGAWASAGGGVVKQCVYASKLDEFVGTNTSWTDVTGMTVTTGAIASTSSRVLVTCALYIYDYTANSFLKITDGSGGDITGFIGAVAGASQIRASSGSIYQDHPNVGRHVSLQLMDTTASTSARTYKLQFIAASGGTVRMNRTSTDTNSNSYGRSVSSIMATEIGA